MHVQLASQLPSFDILRIPALESEGTSFNLSLYTPLSSPPKMYTQLPSIDSRMNAVTAWDDSFELQGAGKDELTVPLLAGYSPVPKTQPKATPIVLKAPVIQWAPLPVREPRVTYPQRRENSLRKYSATETMKVIRNWYKKHTDADRLGCAGKLRGDRGQCQFCKDCGQSHKMSRGSIVPPRGILKKH